MIIAKYIYRVVQVDNYCYVCRYFRFLSSSAIQVLYQSARQMATEAAPAAHVTATAAAPLSPGMIGGAATSGVGNGCEQDAVRVCVCELE